MLQIAVLHFARQVSAINFLSEPASTPLCAIMLLQTAQVCKFNNTQNFLHELRLLRGDKRTRIPQKLPIRIPETHKLPSILFTIVGGCPRVCPNVRDNLTSHRKLRIL